MFDLNSFHFSVMSNSVGHPSPYSSDNFGWNVTFRVNSDINNIHYYLFSIDTSVIYRGTTNTNDEDELREYKYVSSLNDYEGDFYNVKVFVDGEVLHDTYYSAYHYNYLANEKDTWKIKYFVLGRCAYGGWRLLALCKNEYLYYEII